MRQRSSFSERITAHGLIVPISTLFRFLWLSPVARPITIDIAADVIEQLLSDTRSPNTKRAYEKDIKDFLLFIAGCLPSQELVLEFLRLEQHHAVALVLKYKAQLIKKELSEATVNRRLSAIKSLASMGRKLGLCHYTLEDIKREKVESYRDTSGISPSDYANVLVLIDRDTRSGKRDYASSLTFRRSNFNQ